VSAARRPHGDRGVVLILIALLIVALLTMVAIVIDLGALRADRRDTFKSADLAALAAGYHLSGRGDADVTVDPRAACEAALRSVKENTPGFPDDASLACDALPLTGSPPHCDATTDMVTVQSVGSDPYLLTVEYPVPASEISDSRFAGGVGAEDGTPCERMRVTLRHTSGTTFARIIGVDEQTIESQAVVRAGTDSMTMGVAALLLLEREGCGALQFSGGGDSGGILVKASSPTNPGVVVADSAGSTALGCTTNQNASGYVIYGPPLPAAAGGGPSILAEGSADGSPGIIGTFAALVGGRTACCYPDGIHPEPGGSGIVSRAVVDERYNGDANGHAIAALHDAAYAAVTAVTAPAGWTTISGGECKGAVDPANLGAERLFFDCDDGFSTGTASLVFPNARQVTFTGKVEVANNGRLAFPVVEALYVRGCQGSCNGSNDYAVRVANGGVLSVNAGTDPASPLTCEARPAVATGGTRLATFSGPFLVSGQAHLCATTVYLGNDTPTYAPQQQTSGGLGCTPQEPCPVDTGGRAYIEVDSGGGRVSWTAPNETGEPPEAMHPFEDLALWSEASAASALGGQGTNTTSGVFFLPNSSVSFTGQATQEQPLNAQFIARRLDVSGQGVLTLMPNPGDAVTIPIPGAVTLIR